MLAIERLCCLRHCRQNKIKQSSHHAWHETEFGKKRPRAVLGAREDNPSLEDMVRCKEERYVKDLVDFLAKPTQVMK
jgi:hypothetical protein